MGLLSCKVTFASQLHSDYCGAASLKLQISGDRWAPDVTIIHGLYIGRDVLRVVEALCILC
jgi:hypothetical protein